MNGKKYDETFEKYRELKELLYGDVEAYCKGVNSLRPLPDYRNLLFSSEITTLDEKIQANNYDAEAVQVAKDLFNANYKDLKERFDHKRYIYKVEVSHEINKYKNVANAYLFMYHFLQFFAIGGAGVVAITINIPAIPKIIPTVTSGLVTIAAAFLKFYKFRNRYDIYASAYKKLQREYDLYSSDRGRYDKHQAGANLDLFMDRIDKIHEEISELFSSLDELAQQQDKELEQEKVMQAN
jgi:hypothetical protein